MKLIYDFEKEIQVERFQPIESKSMADSDIEEICTDNLIKFRRIFKKNRTPLRVSFRDLTFWLKSNDIYTHRIHSYPGKILPQIVEFFINASYLDEKVILDPFCGSGTIALQASLKGFQTYTADVNPFAQLLTYTKTYPFCPDKLKSDLKLILDEYGNVKDFPSINIINAEIWYSSKRKEELEKLINCIRLTVSKENVNFFLICFSSLAKSFSFADPAISVPVRLKIKSNLSYNHNTNILKRLSWIEDSNILEEFKKIVYSNIHRVTSTNLILPTRLANISVGNDAKSLVNPKKENERLPNGKIPLIITSPPYGSAQKYIRASSLSLNWLELADPKSLRILDKQSIGSENLNKSKIDFKNHFIPPYFQNLLLELSKINYKRALITYKYFLDLRESMQEMSRVLCKNGQLVIIIGNNNVCGSLVRNDLYLIEICKEFGLNLNLFLLDSIKSRGLLTRRHSTASIIADESILVFEKEI